MTETNTVETVTDEGAADRLRAFIAQKEVSIVDVPAPSGFVYRFRKPSKIAMLFGEERLPMDAANAAVESWVEQGIITRQQGDEMTDETAQKMKAAFDVRDRVVELSHQPKIVRGVPQNGNEINAAEVPPEDLEYLYKWVAAGGEVSGLLIPFPERSQPNVVARTHRKKQRNASK